MMLNLPQDILNIIYKKLNDDYIKNIFIISLISSKNENKMKIFYDWNTSQQIGNYLKQIKNLDYKNIKLLKKISNRLAFPDSKLNRKFIIWKGKKVKERISNARNGIHNLFWFHELISIKLSRHFIFCSGNISCWRCCNNLYRPSLLGNSIVIYNLNNKFLPARVIGYNHINDSCSLKIYNNYNDFILNDNHYLKKNIAVKKVFNPPDCWFHHIGWERNSYSKFKNFDKIYPLVDFELVLAKKNAKLALALINLNSVINFNKPILSNKEISSIVDI